MPIPMVDLAALRAEAGTRREVFEAEVRAIDPALTQWSWFRALETAKGRACRTNDDMTHDAALVASAKIRTAYDAYIVALHAFYLARDGANGFLGGYGL